VRTRQGDFTGFVQWDREECVSPDELVGHTADGELSLRFDTIRSIARRSRESSLVTLLDGREFVLSGTRKVGHGNRGVYVDDFPPGGARSRAASPPAPTAASPAGWSTASTKAKSPRRSTPHSRACTTPSPSA
jgi:hypothetical protein